MGVIRPTNYGTGALLGLLEEYSNLPKASLNLAVICISRSSNHCVYLDWGALSGAPFARRAFTGARG
jgi:hypothetical protein